MTKVSGVSLSSALALALSGLLVAACGDDGSPPAFPDGAVNDAQVNDSMSGADARQAVDGAMDADGPMITVLDPTPATTADLSTDAIVSGSRFTVRCEVLRNANGSAVDTGSVKVTAISGGVSIEAAAAPTSVPNEYQGDIVVSGFSNGEMSVRCTASDLASRTNSAEIDTFLDQGPSVSVLAPLPATSYATQVGVSVQVTAAPVATTDPGSVVDFGNVVVQLGGQDITSLLTHDGSGNFAGTVQFADPLFDPTLDGQQTLVVRAPNVRSTTAVLRETATVFTADALGPTIAVTTPTPGQLVSGIVTFTATITDSAGVNPSSVIGTIAGVNDFPLSNTVGDEYEGTFDTRQLGVGMIFPTVVVRAQDAVGNQSSNGFVLALDNQAPLSSLDPPRLRERQESELNGNYECGELFDPLGREAADDGEVVPQLFRLNVRAEDRGNSALANPGTLVPHADINPAQMKLFILDDSSRALIVDTDGDGVCDSINPLLTPTSVPTASDEAAVINMSILAERGGSIFRQIPPTQPDFDRPAFYPGYAEQFACAEPETPPHDEPVVTNAVCGLQSSAIRIIELETSSKSAIWGIPPIDDIQCFGNAFDALATNISDGWACLAVQVEDNLGNLGISPPLRLCIDHDGDKRDNSGADLYSVHGCGESRNILPSDVGAITLGGASTTLSAGTNHTCAVVGGGVRCWGEGGSGQLGRGNTDDIGDDETPSSGGAILSGVTSVAAGGEHTCAITGGNVECWGNGASGRLGYGNTTTLNAPGGTITLGSPATSISAGGQHTCAITSGGVRCWGEGGSGQLGYGDTNDVGDTGNPSAAGAVNFGGGFTAVEVVAGGAHTCARSAAGAVRCWGDNSSGQLGYGNTTNLTSPGADVDFAGTSGDTAVQIAAGDSHTCARMFSGTVRCWGNGADGRLGYGNELTVGDDEDPWIFGELTVSNENITGIAAGANHTCATDQSGSMFCWGRGFSDQLGYNRSFRVGHRGSPGASRFVKLGNVSAIAPGGSHTCAAGTGGVHCWGANDSGQLGHSDKGDNLSNIGDIAPVWMRPDCTGTYDAATNTTDSSTPCTIPESFHDDPGWQVRRNDLG